MSTFYLVCFVLFTFLFNLLHFVLLYKKLNGFAQMPFSTYIYCEGHYCKSSAHIHRHTSLKYPCGMLHNSLNGFALSLSLFVSRVRKKLYFGSLYMVDLSHLSYHCCSGTKWRDGKGGGQSPTPWMCIPLWRDQNSYVCIMYLLLTIDSAESVSLFWSLVFSTFLLHTKNQRFFSGWWIKLLNTLVSALQY